MMNEELDLTDPLVLHMKAEEKLKVKNNKLNFAEIETSVDAETSSV